MKFYLMSALPKEYGTEDEYHLIAESEVDLVSKINMDQLDLDNNYLVLETEVPKAQRVSS